MNVSHLVALAVLITSSAAQQVLYELNGQPGSGFGAVVVALGDVDRDGYPDLAASAPAAGAGAGLVQLLSGRNGAVLRTFTGQAGDNLGRRVWRAGDLDRDGQQDVWLTAANFVRCHSGFDGSVLQTFSATPLFEVAGDVDGDGSDDVISAVTAGGVATVLSARTGTTVMQIGRAPEGIGAVGAAGDVDGDGRADVMLVVLGAGLRVEVVSGRTQAVLFTHPFAQPSARVLRIGTVGDWDGDGRSDYAVVIADLVGTDPRHSMRLYSQGIEVWGHTAQGSCSSGGCVSGGLVVDFKPVPAVFEGGGRSGFALVFEHLYGTLTHSVQFFGASLGHLGSVDGAVCDVLGDVDRDGFSDVAVGSANHDRIRVFGFRPNQIARHEYGQQAFASVSGQAYDVARLADQDGDGVEDYAVSWRRCARVFSAASATVAAANPLGLAFTNGVRLVIGR